MGLLLATSQPAAAASTGTRYQVKRGDTLSGIAARLGIRMSKLASANGIGNADMVMAGTWLTVPGKGSSSYSSSTSSGSGGGTHVVEPGQTLSWIAAHYGLSTSALVQANGIKDPNRVYAGSRLQIPGGTSGDSSSSSGGGDYTPPSSGSSGRLPSRLLANPSRLALMPVFDKWSARYGVSPSLVKSVTWLESGWQSGVVSTTGAVGIGQLMPSTVDTINQILGTNLSPWVPEENIRMSARYIALLLSATGGNARKALAGYYQGLASVQRNGLYPSTIAYVDGVLALQSRFR